MLNRRRSKARRRKRKELFAVQMCFAGALLGLVVGLQSVARKAGEGPHLRRVPVSAVTPASLNSHVCVVEKGGSVHVKFVASSNNRLFGRQKCGSKIHILSSHFKFPKEDNWDFKDEC